MYSYFSTIIAELMLLCSTGLSFSFAINVSDVVATKVGWAVISSTLASLVATWVLTIIQQIRTYRWKKMQELEKI